VRDRLPAGPATAPGTVVFFDTATPVQRVAITLALDAGDLTTAREWLRAHDRWMTWSGAVPGQSEGQALWAQYHRQSGGGEAAYTHAGNALARATEPRQPLALLAAHRLLGELDTEAGQFVDAARHLDASLALADACAAPYERALTLLAMARAHAARGDRVGALRLLDEVRTIGAPLGATPMLACAEMLARRLTAAAQSPPTYPAGLSSREIEVLRLLAAGHSNAAIAGLLSVSVRTVTTHLTAIYTKLGVPSRSAAMRFALDAGLA
jgi:DNA-binding CsgD family transcriptional regulator